jgi:hypothetical protein
VQDLATSELSARSVRHDSTEENLRQLRLGMSSSMGARYRSTPIKPACFQVTPRATHHRDTPEEQLSQIGRALKELNIERISAHSPQAKGRIERAL